MPAFPYPNPQPTGNAITFSDALGTDISADIYTKQRWADSWAAETQLDLLAVTWNAAPNIPTALLRFRYGRVVERGSTAETTRTKKTWIGWYVKIVVHCADGDRVWHGFIDDVADEQHGTIARVVPGAPGDPPTTVYEVAGIQTISCVGMIAALDRAPIQRTYFSCTTAFSNNGTDNYRVAWSAPMFNVSDNNKVKRDQFGATKLPPSRTTGTYSAGIWFDRPNAIDLPTFIPGFVRVRGHQHGRPLDPQRCVGILGSIQRATGWKSNRRWAVWRWQIAICSRLDIRPRKPKPTKYNNPIRRLVRIDFGLRRVDPQRCVGSVAIAKRRPGVFLFCR